MRIMVLAIVAAMFLLWGGWAIRPRQASVSNMLLLAGVALLLLAAGAFFGWY